MRPDEAHVIRRLLTGNDVGDEVNSLSGPPRRLADHLAGVPLEDRPKVWGGFLCSLPDPDGVVASLAAVDLFGPAPRAETARFATVADLRGVMAESRWLWEGWIPSSRIIGVGGFEGTGKTRFVLDLCSRAHRGDPWPDGQPMGVSPGASSVWLCSDAHHDELAETMAAFGLPDEAVYFPTLPEDPYGGTDLDDEATLESLRGVVEVVRPAFVVVDTLTSATGRNLSDQQVMKGLKGPLAELCQAYGTTVILIVHLSREGQALGRRIKGITRTLIHLEAPDPDHSERLRAWVEKSFAKKPPALGVTMAADGNQYDSEPPEPPAKAPARSAGGRPPEKQEKAIAFLREKLSAGDRRGVDLIDEWQGKGEAKGTIFNARRAMQEEGTLVVDDSKKPQIWHLNSDPGEPADNQDSVGVNNGPRPPNQRERPGILGFPPP